MISRVESKFSHFLRDHVKKLQDLHRMLGSKIVLDFQTSECQRQHEVIEHSEFLYNQSPLAITIQFLFNKSSDVLKVYIMDCILT